MSDVPAPNPNSRQVGGDHYRKHGGPDAEQHWDRSNRLGYDPFQYQITKYVERWKDKGGVQDLEKALHFLEKYIALIKAGTLNPAYAAGTGMEARRPGVYVVPSPVPPTTEEWEKIEQSILHEMTTKPASGVRPIQCVFDPPVETQPEPETKEQP